MASFYFSAKSYSPSQFAPVILELNTGEVTELPETHKNVQLLIAAMEERLVGDALYVSPKRFRRETDMLRKHSLEMLAVLQSKQDEGNFLGCFVYGSACRRYREPELNIKGYFHLIDSDRDTSPATMGKGFYQYVVMVQPATMTIEEEENYELTLISGPGQERGSDD